VATAADILLLKIGNVLLVGIEITLVFCFDDANVTDLLLGLSLRVGRLTVLLCSLLNKFLPAVDELLNSLLFAVEFFDEMSFGFVLFVGED
jgi:hypothetical protein